MRYAAGQGWARVMVGLLLGVLGLAMGALPAHANEQGVIRLEVTIGKSQVVELKEPFTRVSVTNPAIADVFVVTPNQILVSGKAVGTTSLIVFYPRQTVFFDLLVQTDLALLRERLKHVAPKDEIEVQAAQESLILTGTSTSEQVMAGAIEVASVFAPKGKVISLLSVTDVKPQQVLAASPCGGGHARGAERARLQHSCLRRHPPGGRNAGQRLFPGPGHPGRGRRAGIGRLCGRPEHAGIRVPREQLLPVLGGAGLRRAGSRPRRAEPLPHAREAEPHHPERQAGEIHFRG